MTASRKYLLHAFLNHITEDKDGYIWVAIFDQMVDRYDPQTGNFTHFVPKEANRDQGVIRLYLPPSTPRTFWVANLAGPASLDLDTGEFTYHYRDELSWTDAMLEDSKKRFWIASENGLHLFDRVTEEFETFTEREGLANNLVKSIVEDDQGFLWLGTDNRLSRFDPATRSFKNFTVRDGLPSNRFEESGFFKAESGALFFMTRGGAGWFSFHPSELNEERGAVSMALTQLDIKGEQAGVDGASPLDRAVLFTEEVTLSHDQNELTFHYAGLNAQHPESVEYQYMLEGFDSGWVHGGTQRFVRYNQLPAGEYTFLVRGSETGVDWSAPRSLRVEVLPPWWRTSAAYLLYGLLLIGSVVSIDRFQRRRLLQKAKLREAGLKTQAVEALSREATALAREAEARAQAFEEENKRKEVEIEKAEELRQAHAALETSYEDLQQTHTRLQETQEQLIHAEKMASLGQLTAGIAHEIKNPLNFINNFAQLNTHFIEDIRQYLTYGQYLTYIVMAMIEHSRTGPGERRPVELNQLLDDHVRLAYHGMQSREEGFAVELDCDYDERIGEVEVSPQELGRVFINLLNNAFDAVRERAQIEAGHVPRVHIKTVRREDGIEVQIKDNGVGIPDQVRDRVFQPFFTTKPVGSGSTGLG